MAKNLKEKVYDKIIDDIYSSRYTANEIITEASLVKKLGVSKSPIRDALQMLCHEGVLNNIPRCGYQVVALSSKDVKEILDFRMILETGMLNNVKGHITQAYIDRLKELDALCNKNTDNVYEHWIYNTDFHVTLASATDNEYVCDSIRGAMNTLWRAYVQIHYGTWQDKIPKDTRYHEDIIQALEEERIDDAIEYLKDDLDDFGII